MRIYRENIPPTERKALRGRMLIRETKNGIVAQAWPKPRGKARSGYPLYHELEFGRAAYMAAHPHPLDLGTATNWVRGTTMVPRDMLVMAAMGTLFEITTIDGQVWRPQRMAFPNPQGVLDLVTDIPGSLLFRSPVGWVRVPVGNQGTILRMGPSATPRWEPLPEPHFNGARAAITTAASGLNFSTLTTLTWPTTLFDNGGWHNPASTPARLVAPLGTTVAQANLQLRFDSVNATATGVALIIQRRADHTQKFAFDQNANVHGNLIRFNISTGPTEIEDGDYFIAQIGIAGDNSVDRIATVNMFAARVLSTEPLV